MAAICPGVRRGCLGSDNVDGAGGILVVVKFADAIGIIGEAEDNTTLEELAGGGVNEEEPRLSASSGAEEEVPGIPVGGEDINSLLETWSLLVIPTCSAVGGWYPICHSQHEVLTLSLKSNLPVLHKECIGDSHFPSLSLADNLPVANHLIPLNGPVTHPLIARAQPSIHPPPPLASPHPQSVIRARLQPTVQAFTISV